MADPADGETPPVDFGDEARKLISTVQQWAQRALPAPPSGHGGPECQWCPLCQVASVLRGDHPELTERMVEAGTTVATALRSLIESATNAGAAAPTGSSTTESTTAPSTTESTTTAAPTTTESTTTTPPTRPRPRPRTDGD
jgi:hypothetical protein